MSKIGRKPIPIGNVSVEIKENQIHYQGKQASGVHVLDNLLTAELKDNNLYIKPTKTISSTNRIWGLHRALIANKITGADIGFERKLQINGLGYKAISQGANIQFSLGFSHKIDFGLPTEVVMEIDKTGQLLTLKSPYKDILGQVCSDIRSLRPPEPYKGTGIKYLEEVIIRKAGKTKS